MATDGDMIGRPRLRSREAPEALDVLQDASQEMTVERAVAAVRQFLDMEVAYTTGITEEQLIFRILDGDGASFGFAAGAAMPIERTYCRRILEGRLPNLIPDVRSDPRSATLAITAAADVGAFVSVPLRLSDGSVPGTLCAASHQARPDLRYRDLQFLQVFARMIADQIERHMLEERRRGVEMQAALVGSLVAAVTTRDSYTGEHSHCVVDNARAVAERMGLSTDEIEDVANVALLHDIGKLGVPDAILHKPGALDEAEWEEMRRHPVYAAELIAKVPGLGHLAPALRAEHERWDGGGYPDGLSGVEIPVASRITLVCDAYDAMTSDRPYRQAMREREAREEIRRGTGTQFCPGAAAALLVILSEDD